MTVYILRRVLAAIPVLFLCSVLIFALGRLLPGDAVSFIAGPNSTLTADQVETIRRQYGLDQPVVTQYTIWLGKMLTGDLGRSFLFQHARVRCHQFADAPDGTDCDAITC